MLEASWVGSSTVPASGLYPHQWSWDSAFITIGRSWYDQGRAQAELEELFRGQWSDGRIPHIVFNPSVPDGAYFPGPSFWMSSQTPRAPRDVETSGIIQPPLHAAAALEIHDNAQDPREARAFLERVYARLVSWHAYLARHRDPDGIGLAAILHPWESGLDNSPAWDEALDDLVVRDDLLPAYERRDLVAAEAEDRPTDDAYRRFVHLAAAYREVGYDDERLCRSSPFVVAGPLLNSILIWSSLALARIARLVGDDPEPHLLGAARVRAGIQSTLWHPGDARYYSRNLRTDQFLRDPSILSFLPLLDPELPVEGRDAIVRDLSAPCFHPPETEEHYLIPSYDLTGELFDPRRYWRGPVWLNTDWLVWRGLLQHGQHRLADHVTDSMLSLAKRSGFREYFNPFTGEGHGSDGFAWSAALVIDVIERRARMSSGTWSPTQTA
ncbi:MAG: hypothetical protein K5924_02125 [Chloroflexi bacterium]|nr:hypothetical protein [Chloroflexota bacterium]